MTGAITAAIRQCLERERRERSVDDDAIYMEIDYVGNIGLTVLTE